MKQVLHTFWMLRLWVDPTRNISCLFYAYRTLLRRIILLFPNSPTFEFSLFRNRKAIQSILDYIGLVVVT